MSHSKIITKRLLTQPLFAAAFALLLLTVAAVPAQAATLTSQTIWGTPAHESVDGVAVAADGSTYLTGIHRVGFDPSKIFLVKFAPDQTVSWQETWDGPAQFFDNNARDVAVAPDGSAVYVTGSSFISPNVAVLLKFNPLDGSLVWDRSWGGNAFPEGVAVGSDGSVYVAGSVRLDFNQQIFVTKFTPDGAVVWHRVWNTPESRGDTQGQDVTIDGAGNIYVAGVTPRPDPNLPGGFIGAVALLKIDSDGNLIWQRTVGADGGIDARGGVAVAPDGSVYVAGGRFDERTSDLNALVLKFGADGSLLWNRHWGGRSGDDAAGVAVRGDGAIFVSGNTNSFGSGSDDAFLLRLAPNAKVQDAMTWGGPGIDHGDSIAVNSAGNVVIGATAEEPPYSFLGASMRLSKDRITLETPDFPLISVESGVTSAGGVVEPIAGTTNDDPGFDAALLGIAP
jgi:uncharacterized delta-60 repeat protein